MTRIVRRAFVALLIVLAMAGANRCGSQSRDHHHRDQSHRHFRGRHPVLHRQWGVHELISMSSSNMRLCSPTARFMPPSPRPARLWLWHRTRATQTHLAGSPNGGGFNQSPGGAVNGTFTFSVRGQFEDGTKINFHRRTTSTLRRRAPSSSCPLPRLTDQGREFIRSPPLIDRPPHAIFSDRDEPAEEAARAQPGSAVPRPQCAECHRRWSGVCEARARARERTRPRRADDGDQP